MSYGMQIRTVNGLENIDSLRSLREVFRTRATSASGSVTLPTETGANESNSILFFQTFDGKATPFTSWSGSTISWSSWAFYDPSSNFDLIVCRFK